MKQFDPVKMKRTFAEQKVLANIVYDSIIENDLEKMKQAMVEVQDYCTKTQMPPPVPDSVMMTLHYMVMIYVLQNNKPALSDKLDATSDEQLMGVKKESSKELIGSPAEETELEKDTPPLNFKGLVKDLTEFLEANSGEP